MSNVAQYDFSLNLHRQVAHANENAIFSPISIVFTLAMCYLGSNGTTKTQLKSTMFGRESNDETTIKSVVDAVHLQPSHAFDKFSLKSANRLYSQQSFAIKNEYKSAINRKFRADILSVDFAQSENVRQQINHWVANETSNKIQNLIQPGLLNSMTRLVLVNALYFKSEWFHLFSKEKISEKSFFNQPSKNSIVKMMKDTRDYLYFENEDLQVLELPFKGPNLNMIILLPKEKHGLKTVLQNLNGQTLKDIFGLLRSDYVEVHLPKFKIEQDFELKKTLKRLGIVDAFDETKANFVGITGKNELFISQVVHKAFIEVTENGTEAAAATAAIMMLKSSLVINDSSLKVFQADHPFLFAITTGVDRHILFLGQFYGH